MNGEVERKHEQNTPRMIICVFFMPIGLVSFSKFEQGRLLHCITVRMLHGRLPLTVQVPVSPTSPASSCSPRPPPEVCVHGMFGKRTEVFSLIERCFGIQQSPPVLQSAHQETGESVTTTTCISKSLTVSCDWDFSMVEAPMPPPPPSSPKEVPAEFRF